MEIPTLPPPFPPPPKSHLATAAGTIFGLFRFILAIALGLGLSAVAMYLLVSALQAIGCWGDQP